MVTVDTYFTWLHSLDSRWSTIFLPYVRYAHVGTIQTKNSRNYICQCHDHTIDISVTNALWLLFDRFDAASLSSYSFFSDSFCWNLKIKKEREKKHSFLAICSRWTNEIRIGIKKNRRLNVTNLLFFYRNHQHHVPTLYKYTQYIQPKQRLNENTHNRTQNNIKYQFWYAKESQTDCDFLHHSVSVSTLCTHTPHELKRKQQQ